MAPDVVVGGAVDALDVEGPCAPWTAAPLGLCDMKGATSPGSTEGAAPTWPMCCEPGMEVEELDAAME